MNLATYELSIKYKGEAIKEGRIPVDDLAPSLLALSDSIQEVKKIIYPESEPVSLEIEATESGSFDVKLILATGKAIFSKAVKFLNSSQTTAALNLATLTNKIYKVIKFFIDYFNKKIIKKVDLTNKKQKIIFDDGTSIEADKNIVKLYESYEVKTSFHKVFEPLEKDGIDLIEIVSEKKTKIIVSKDDYEKIKVPKTKHKTMRKPKRKKIGEHTIDVELYIKSISFDSNKWKFGYSNDEFFASIKDKDFIDNVSKNQTQFGSTDILKVRLKIETYRTTKGLKQKYTVEKVLEHKKGLSTN